MYKNLIVIIAVVALALGVYYYAKPSQDHMMQSDAMMVGDEMVKTDDVMTDDVMTDDAMMEDESMMEQSNRYLPFTPTALADSSSYRRVL